MSHVRVWLCACMFMSNVCERASILVSFTGLWLVRARVHTCFSCVRVYVLVLLVSRACVNACMLASRVFECVPTISRACVNSYMLVFSGVSACMLVSHACVISNMLVFPCVRPFAYVCVSRACARASVRACSRVCGRLGRSPRKPECVPPPAKETGQCTPRPAPWHSAGVGADERADERL